MAQVKIHPRYVSKARNLIFNRRTLTGGAFSRIMNMNYYALRSRFTQRGVEPEVAIETAEVLESWATECLEAANQLRSAASRSSQR